MFLEVCGCVCCGLILTVADGTALTYHIVYPLEVEKANAEDVVCMLEVHATVSATKDGTSPSSDDVLYKVQVKSAKGVRSTVRVHWHTLLPYTHTHTHTHTR